MNVTGSTVAGPQVNYSRQTSMWNLTTSWQKATTTNPSFASLKGNPFKDSPLSESEQSEATCSIDDDRCVFIFLSIILLSSLFTTSAVYELSTCR